MTTGGGLLYTTGLMQHMTWSASHDALTGLPNGSWLGDAFPREAVAHDGVSGFLFIDIDHFKQYNDNYGHAVGDRVLGLVATTIRDRVKGSDLVVRLHGDEFVVVLFGLASQRDMGGVARRLRTAVADIAPPTAGASALSISVGGVYDVQAGVALEDVLRLAGECMYTAKRSELQIPVIVPMDTSSEQSRRSVGFGVDRSVATASPIPGSLSGS
jgi:diguanylate cyclase (GGDEF)-like protein